MKHWSGFNHYSILLDNYFFKCVPVIFHAWDRRKMLHFFLLLSHLVVFNQIKLNDILSSWSYKYQKRLLHEFLQQWLTIPLLSYDSPIRVPLGNFIISLWLYILETIRLLHDTHITTNKNFIALILQLASSLLDSYINTRSSSSLFSIQKLFTDKLSPNKYLLSTSFSYDWCNLQLCFWLYADSNKMYSITSDSLSNYFSFTVQQNETGKILGNLNSNMTFINWNYMRVPLRICKILELVRKLVTFSLFYVFLRERALSCSKSHLFL